jgi:hypothetical protein
MHLPRISSATLAILFSALLARGAVVDVSIPRGNLLELHSCELFAGSCVVSSEAETSGNYVLRVWQFDSGSVAGVSLRGLSIALLEKGDQNLAVPENGAESAVAYVPEGISPAQRCALVAWVARNTQARLDATHIKTAPLSTHFDADRISFSAGREIAFSGGTPTVCNVGGCGEMLWYEPRSAVSSYVVDQLTRSSIVEPVLGVKWMDHGRRTLFVGRFGDPEPSSPAICGPGATAAL